jgi:hypothetical protein
VNKLRHSLTPSAATFAEEEISGFRSGVLETFGLLGCYAAQVGNWLQKFWYNISAPSSRVKQFQKNFHPPGYPVTDVVLKAPIKKTHCVLGGR